MGRLILMRHAKSSWDDPFMDDHDRPLNKRGRASAQVLGDWLRDVGALPDLVLCSTSARTRETLTRLNVTADVRFEAGLYHAGPAKILSILQRADAPSVLILAHNPGIAECAERIVAAPHSHPRFVDYPTGATLIADFEQPWSQTDWGRGRVKDFIIPRDLMP